MNKVYVVEIGSYEDGPRDIIKQGIYSNIKEAHAVLKERQDEIPNSNFGGFGEVLMIPLFDMIDRTTEFYYDTSFENAEIEGLSFCYTTGDKVIYTNPVQYSFSSEEKLRNYNPKKKGTIVGWNGMDEDEHVIYVIELDEGGLIDSNKGYISAIK